MSLEEIQPEEGTPPTLGVDELKAQIFPDHPIFQVEEVCKSERIPYAWQVTYENTLELRADLPNGRNKRPHFVGTENAQDFLSFNFQKIKYLAGYDAILFSDEGVIEARLMNYRTQGGRSVLQLPGIRIRHRSPTLFDDFDQAEEASFNVAPARMPKWTDDWSLKLEGEFRGSSIGVEFCSASDRFYAFGDAGPKFRPPTIRITGIAETRHDEAVLLLERISDAVLFECDIKYGILTSIARSRQFTGPTRRRRRPITPAPPRIPRNQYQSKPLSLYRYGRIAAGMPLLQFLAFYQVLEYHFSSYSRRDALNRIRNEIRDPAFEPENDSHLSRILSLASLSGRGYGSERDQLKATIKACVTPEQLRDFFADQEDRKQHFSDSKIIRSVPTVDLVNTRIDIVDQVSNRIYDLRCRIVHTKEDGADKLPDLLLPFSKEADALSPDIELVEFLAQKVLIASSSPIRI